MGLLFALLSILLAVLATAYLQLPTFILSLGYGWSHNMEIKRWLVRALALGAFVLFLSTQPPTWAIILTALLLTFFLAFSLINANPNVFRELYPQHLHRTTQPILPSSFEIVGYLSEGGQAIAYPIESIIKPRHLINDLFDNEPILFSFCAACRSSIVYSRMLDGQELHFQVIGVYRRNMIMRDRETGTIWQQGTGEAVHGRLRGKQLTLLPYQQMSLDEWLRLYPQSLVAEERADAPRGLFPKAWLVKMLAVTNRMVTPGRTDLSGLPLREKVWGLEIGRHTKAYPLSELKKVAHIQDRLGDVDIEINYSASSNRITGQELRSGKALKFQSHWWFGWKEFHPDTAVWKTRQPQEIQQ